MVSVQRVWTEMDEQIVAHEHADVQCLAYGCAQVADERLVVEVSELRLVYAVCGMHSCDTRRGSFYAQPEHANRGLIGLRF